MAAMRSVVVEIAQPFTEVSLRFGQVGTVGQEGIAPGQDSKLGYVLLLETLVEMFKAAGKRRNSQMVNLPGGWALKKPCP